MNTPTIELGKSSSIFALAISRDKRSRPAPGLNVSEQWLNRIENQLSHLVYLGPGKYMRFYFPLACSTNYDGRVSYQWTINIYLKISG